MAERIAVTGANGFVGRSVVLAAAAEGLEVAGLVRSEQAARAVAGAGGRPVRVPALEAAPLAQAFAGARAVVHLAQIGSEQGGATYEAVNVGGTRAVVAGAQEAGVPRVVLLSGLGVARYGMARRTTNAYFLSKLAAEVELYRSGLEVVVFRPSYIVGPGGELIPQLLREMAEGEVERIGDGSHRMQPIALRDAAAAVLAAIGRRGPHPAVFDLVGPEAASYQQLIERVSRLARARGRGGPYRIREIAVAEADRRAASGGYRGMLPDALDCFLCDEVSDARPLEALLGRFLAPLDEVLDAAVRAATTGVL